MATRSSGQRLTVGGPFDAPSSIRLATAFLGFFWNDRFCSSNPIENVVRSFVQAAGRVNMDVKVSV
jgi:hypothetical protein